MFARHLCPCAPFGLERQVEILQRAALPASFDAFPQFIGQFPLLVDGFDDGLLSFCYLLEFFVCHTYLCDLYLIEVSCPLLTVTGDKGYGASEVEQGDGVVHALFSEI